MQNQRETRRLQIFTQLGLTTVLRCTDLPNILQVKFTRGYLTGALEVPDQLLHCFPFIMFEDGESISEDQNSRRQLLNILINSADVYVQSNKFTDLGHFGSI